MPILVFLPNLGMGGSEAAAAVVTAAGEPTGKVRRRRYTLPDGRRILATDEQIRLILRQYQAEPEKVELPREVEEIVSKTLADVEETPEPAPPDAAASLFALAEEVGPQLVMEVTDDLTKQEAIWLGKLIDLIEDDEAAVALLLLN